MSNTNAMDEKIQYSKVLSSLFCSTSIFSLSILSLLNNLSIDIYSMVALLKVVIPASCCFWILGNVIGKILDKYDNIIVKTKEVDDAKAYEIPSIFSDAQVSSENDEFGDIL